LKFETSDLVLLFESETYRNGQCASPSEYWLPLLALFTGARLNELSQLTASDIGQHDGVDTISILDEDTKRLKNESSRRIVPIHAKLIELGFLDYVGMADAGRIFPELTEAKSKPGDFSKEASRSFTAYRRLVGVGSDTFNAETKKWKSGNMKVFHSFRTTLISALRKADVPKDRRTRLAGHQYSDEQDLSYTGGDALTMFDFSTLKADIDSVAYDVRFSPYKPR
jgi:integrase